MTIKKESELTFDRAVTEVVNSVDDRSALAEMVSKKIERNGADENRGADEVKGDNPEGGNVCKVLVGQSA